MQETERKRERESEGGGEREKRLESGLKRGEDGA